MRIQAALLISAVMLFALATPTLAWKGELAAGVLPISEVNEKAESGDLVVVQGHISDVSMGSGSRYIVTLKDDTGSVLVRVPEHLLRKVAEGRSPEVGAHVRVGGKWAHAYLDRETWGIHAQTAERVEE
jgi:exonuclease VII large subunit